MATFSFDNSPFQFHQGLSYDEKTIRDVSVKLLSIPSRIITSSSQIIIDDEIEDFQFHQGLS